MALSARAAHAPAPLGVYDVRAFGARCDGVTDDRAAIQDALDAAVVAGGGTVHVPPGVCGVKPARSGAEYVLGIGGSNITLSGMGRGSVLKVLDGAGDYGRLFMNTVSPVWNVTFADFRIDQNPAGNGRAEVRDDLRPNANGAIHTAQVAIFLWRSANVVVDGMDFDACTGVNTVTVGGEHSEAVVRNSHFRFVKARTQERQRDGTRYYDNSSVYLETSGQVVVGNLFETSLEDDAFGAIEVHGGRAVVAGNTSIGFETLVNIQSRGHDLPDTDPNDIAITGNSASLAKAAVRLMPDTGRAIRNVTVSGNVFEIANAARAARRHSNDGWVGVGTVYSTSGKVDGAIEGLVITGNRISFQKETRPYGTSDETLTSGVLLQMQGRGIRDVVVASNAITNAPKLGISLWARGGSTAERVQIHDNLIVDAGSDAADSSGYRAAIYLAGRLRAVEVKGNAIVDTAPGPVPHGAWSVAAYGAGGDVRFERNTVRVYGTGALRSVVKGLDATWVASAQRRRMGPAPRMVPDPAWATDFDVEVTRDGAYTLAAPEVSLPGMEFTLRVRNVSGGAVGALSFDPAYALAPWTSLPARHSRTITFKFDGSRWVESSRTPVDVPE